MPHKENRLLAVLISDLLEKHNCTPDSWIQRKPATAGSHFQLSRTSHVQRESSPDNCYFQSFKPKIVLMDKKLKGKPPAGGSYFQPSWKNNCPPDSWIQRKPATAGSHFQPSRTSHVQRESSPDDCYFKAFKPKIVLMDNFCSLKPIHIGIDFLDVFVVFEGVVEFFKGC